MININEVIQTNKMIQEEKLDVRTITWASLLDCCDSSVKECCKKIHTKITTLAKDLVKTGEDISREYGIPIVNKKISVTPIALVGASCCKTIEDYVEIAKTLDQCAKELRINFIGVYSAIVNKSMTPNEVLFINSIPEALSQTERVCSVGLDMIAIPGNTSEESISGIIADEMALGMINNKTTATRLIPAYGKKVGEEVEFGGLLGSAPIMKVNEFNCSDFVNRKGRIPAPVHSFKN